jgi:hypothetical protein
MFQNLSSAGVEERVCKNFHDKYSGILLGMTGAFNRENRPRKKGGLYTVQWLVLSTTVISCLDFLRQDLRVGEAI